MSSSSTEDGGTSVSVLDGIGTKLSIESIPLPDPDPLEKISEHMELKWSFLMSNENY